MTETRAKLASQPELNIASAVVSPAAAHAPIEAVLRASRVNHDIAPGLHLPFLGPDISGIGASQTSPGTLSALHNSSRALSFNVLPTALAITRGSRPSSPLKTTQLTLARTPLPYTTNSHQPSTDQSVILPPRQTLSIHSPKTSISFTGSSTSIQ